MVARPGILDHVASLGHAVFTKGRYNLNIVGVRTRNGTPDKFDDWLVVSGVDAHGWFERWFKVTLDPGLRVITSPSNPKGAAIIANGQYRGVYKIDDHADKYEALCQRNGVVKVWRDNDRDDEHDIGVNPDVGWFGINIHASTSDPYNTDVEKTKVQGWSEGCIVFAKSWEFRYFMWLCWQQVETNGWKTFTLTIIDEPEWMAA